MFLTKPTSELAYEDIEILTSSGEPESIILDYKKMIAGSERDELLALWTDGVAVDNDPGIEATLTFPGFSAQKVVGIDVLHGFEQQIITSTEDGSLVISNLLVKDYPIILRLTD